MRQTFLLAFFISLAGLCQASFFSNLFNSQTVGVRGTLMCGDMPLNNTRVKLWDDDFGPDPDEELAMTRTDAKGNFQLSGSTKEVTNIDVRLKIYHDCDDILPCQRKVKFTIPTKYINSGDKVSTWFDAGILNMELEFKGEERDCSFESLND